MIQPNELRIGNYILGVYTDYSEDEDQEKEEVCEVLALDSVDVNEYPIWVEGESSSVEVYDRFEPIPLTEEWLVKFGFKLTNDEGDVKYYDFINNSDYSIVFDHSEIALHYNTKSGYYCIMYDDDKLKHVHQLQNLYFCLVGKELQQTNN